MAVHTSLIHKQLHIFSLVVINVESIFTLCCYFHWFY